MQHWHFGVALFIFKGIQEINMDNTNIYVTMI
jgi:hypothetical protein